MLTRMCHSLCVSGILVCNAYVCVKGDNISGQGGTSWAVVSHSLLSSRLNAGNEPKEESQIAIAKAA